MNITYTQIREAMASDGTKLYPMSLVGSAAKAVEEAVNQGIDAHLEGCFCPDRGDNYEWSGHRLECRVSAESLPVLLRRLVERENEIDWEEDEEFPGLAADILSTLGIHVDECDFLDIIRDERETPESQQPDDDENSNDAFLEGRMTPEEYAQLWGDGSSSDGCLFYNFWEEGHDPEFLWRFVRAIDRTIAGRENTDDVDGLNELKRVCLERLETITAAQN